MALSFGLTDARKMLKVLDPEYAEWQARVKVLKKQIKDEGEEPLAVEELERLTDMMEQAEEFGSAALQAAMEIIEAKAKFTVVSQIKEPDNKGDKTALAWYATEKQAIGDALALTMSNLTHEEAFAWILPVHHGSPHAFYKGRKEVQKAEGLDLEYRKAELARREAWFRDNPDDPIPLDWSVEVVTKIDTDECEACYGLGRIPKEEVKRRSKIPEHERARTVRASQVVASE